MKTTREGTLALLALLVCALGAAPISAQKSTDESAWEAKVAKENSKKPINDVDTSALLTPVNAADPELLNWKQADPKKTKPYDPKPLPPPQPITDEDVNTLLMYRPPLAVEKPPKPAAPPKPPAKPLPPDDGTWGMLLLGLKPEKTTTSITPRPPPTPTPTQPDRPPAPAPTDTAQSDGRQDLQDRKDGLQAQIDRLRDQNSRDRTTIANNPNSRDDITPDINYRQQQIDELNKQKNEVEGQIQRHDQSNSSSPSLADQEPSMDSGGSGPLPDAPPLLDGLTSQKEKDRSAQTSSSWVDMKNQSKDAQATTIGDEANQKNKNLLAGANADAQNTRDQAARTSAQQQDANSWSKIAGNSLVDSVKQGGEAFGKGVGGSAASGVNLGTLAGGPSPDGGGGASTPADGGGGGGGSAPSGGGGSRDEGNPGGSSTGGGSPGGGEGTVAGGGGDGGTSGGATLIQTCPKCGWKSKVLRSALEFVAVCPSCGQDRVTFGPGTSTPASTGVESGGSPEDAGASDFYGKATPVGAARSTNNREAFNSSRRSADKSPPGNATPAKAK